MKILTLFNFFDLFFTSLIEKNIYFISILFQNNKYLAISILVILFIILYIPSYLQYKKNIKLINGKDYDAFIYFHSLRISNIYITLCKVFLYMVFNVIFILYLRSLSLGFTKDLKAINLYTSFTLVNTFLLISFLLFLYAYYQFTDLIFFKEITKLHIFYCKKTRDPIFTLRYKRFLTKTYLLEPIIMTLSYCLNSDSRKDYDKTKHKWHNYRQKYNEKQSVFGLDGFLQEKIREELYEWCKDHLIRQKVLTLIYKAAKWIIKYISAFYKEMALVIVITVLIYDLNQEKLHYIYYALFIYTIILMYRKLQEFLWGLDVGFDITMYDLLYEGPYFPDMMYSSQKIEDNNEKDFSSLTKDQLKECYEISDMQRKQAAVLHCTIDLLYYFLNNMKVEYMQKNKDFNYHTVPTWPIRRIILLLTAYISIYYICIVRHIEIIVFNIHIQNANLLFLGLLTIIYITKLWYTTGYTNTSTFFIVSHTKYGSNQKHVMFLFITITVSLLTFLIFIKTKIMLNSSEFLINTSIITILDHYTFEEKIKFLFQYVQYVIVALEVPLQHQTAITNIFHSIDYTNLIDKDTSLELIKEYTINFIIDIYKLNEMINSIPDNLYNNFVEEPIFTKILRNSLILANITVLSVKYYQIIKITLNLLFDPSRTTFTIINDFIKYIFGI